MIPLSIIVPVYNTEDYLPKCIDSILAQTFHDFELILIDDGSSDRCGEICDEYAAKDTRIRVIHSENRGVSAARNTGLDIAQGEYIGFADSDDWIEPEMYETMIRTAQENEVDVVICGIKYVQESGEYIRSDLCGTGYYSRDDLLRGLYGTPNNLGGGCCNKIFLFSKIKDARFRTDLTIAEDSVYLFESFRRCSSALKKPGCYYNVVERKNSATRKNEINAYYEIFFRGKASLLLFARDYSHELECLAVDKYMDDCIRYSNIIRNLGKETHQPYRMKFLRIRFQILKQMPRVILKRLLPKEKIHGFLYSMIRN